MKDLTNLSCKWERQEWLYLLLTCLVAFLVILPVEVFGIPDGADLQQHYQFALTFYDSILAGDFFPGWAAKSNYGFGSVGIRFYPPLGYYVLALFRFICGNWYEASWLTFSFWMMTGSVGVYLWGREFLSAKAALFAAIAYSLMPNHLTAIYSYFLYGEFVSAAILPFCFAFVTRICRSGKLSGVFYLAASFALLILSHLPTTIIGSAVLFLYALVLLERNKLKEQLVKLGGSVLLALMASALYWTRLITELSWVNHSADKYHTGDYDFRNQFLPFFLHFSQAEYFKRGLFYADWIALLTTLLLLPPLLFLLADKVKNRENGFHRSKPLLAIMVVGLISLFMLTCLSYFIWERISLLQEIQIPWRWMSVLTLAGAVAVAAAIERVWNEGRPQRTLAYPFIALFVGIMIFNLTQTVAPTASAPYTRERFQLEIASLLESESYECWWTSWSKSTAFTNKLEVSSGERNVEIVLWANEQREFTVASGEPMMARVATFYYPHWRAKVNGQPVEIRFAEDGTLLIPLPPEQASVKIWFQEPFLLDVATAISLATWLILTACFCISLLNKVRKKK